ncbi:MAG: serine hydrolase domain-containing protein, partial [Bacteroidota bacterium]|nr:serine hydrolase domain-containing protein [Bacteroidota bacterium]
MKNLLLVLLIFYGLSYNLFAQSDDRLKGLDSELEKVLKSLDETGFAVAIVEKNKVLYSKGFGYRDYENKIPVDANTLFAIGSCTKAFTSSILGLLNKEGKLDFEDSPIDYVKELRFYNAQMNDMITIRDLMSHRTGIPRHDFSWYFFPTFSKDSLIARIEYHEPFTSVRNKYYYNNFMFLLQGVIGERITGNLWEDNIRSMFFEPLEMIRSNLSIAEMNEAENAAIGYLEEHKETDYYKIAGMRPAGSINSSVNEMSKWLITWINGGKYGDKEILPASYVREAISSQNVMGARLPMNDRPGLHFANYGFGWSL